MPVRLITAVVVGMLTGAVGCSSVPPAVPVQAAPVLKVKPALSPEPKIVLSETPPANKIIKSAPRRIPETDPALAIEARKKITRAQKHYTSGEYDKAESLLKESITTFPFLAQAQLTLGKIFLIKGSAARDMALLNSARLMFEMAAAIDPGLAEVQTLLELFTVRYPE